MVLSLTRDMAPNLTGISAIDQEASNSLVKLAIDFALSKSVLKGNGSFVAKIFLTPQTKGKANSAHSHLNS